MPSEFVRRPRLVQRADVIDALREAGFLIFPLPLGEGQGEGLAPQERVTRPFFIYLLVVLDENNKKYLSVNSPQPTIATLPHPALSQRERERTEAGREYCRPVHRAEAR